METQVLKMQLSLQSALATATQFCCKLRAYTINPHSWNYSCTRNFLWDILLKKKIRPSTQQTSVHGDWRSSAITFIKNSFVGKRMKNSLVKSSDHCIIHQEKLVWKNCTTLFMYKDFIMDSLLIFHRYWLRIAKSALLHWTWFIMLPQFVESLLWVDKWICNSPTYWIYLNSHARTQNNTYCLADNPKLI
jgi:hypothetical protein